jgi:hypothetical protein
MEPRLIELSKDGFRPNVETLEERITPTHLAHAIVHLPEAAQGTVGGHTRAILIFCDD